MIIPNHKIPRDPKSAVPPSMMIIFVSKNFAQFTFFLENPKGCGSLRLFKIFKMFYGLIVTGVYSGSSNSEGDCRLPHNLVFVSPMENGGKKSENIEYIWHYDSDFLQSFCMCFKK